MLVGVGGWLVGGKGEVSVVGWMRAGVCDGKQVQGRRRSIYIRAEGLATRQPCPQAEHLRHGHVMVFAARQPQVKGGRGPGRCQQA